MRTTLGCSMLFWTSPGSSMPQNSSGMATYLPCCLDLPKVMVRCLGCRQTLMHSYLTNVAEYIENLYVFINISAWAGGDIRSIFKWISTGLIRVFLLDWFPYPGWRARSALLFIPSWRENNWIHSFPEGISTMWNANSLVQFLNSISCVHFLWW